MRIKHKGFCVAGIFYPKNSIEGRIVSREKDRVWLDLGFNELICVNKKRITG